MLMEELICTLSSTSESDSLRGTRKYSMWEDSIRTLNLARAALGVDMITQSKMGMLLLEDWKDPENTAAERAYLQLQLNGLKLWLSRLERSFGELLKSWTLVRWYDPSHLAELSQTGDTAWTVPPTQLREGLYSAQTMWRDSRSGLTEILEDIMEEVSDLTPPPPPIGGGCPKGAPLPPPRSALVRWDPVKPGLFA